MNSWLWESEYPSAFMEYKHLGYRCVLNSRPAVRPCHERLNPSIYSKDFTIHRPKEK
jgi:hypothetical protein